MKYPLAQLVPGLTRMQADTILQYGARTDSVRQDKAMYDQTVCRQSRGKRRCDTGCIAKEWLVYAAARCVVIVVAGGGDGLYWL